MGQCVSKVNDNLDIDPVKHLSRDRDLGIPIMIMILEHCALPVLFIAKSTSRTMSDMVFSTYVMNSLYKRVSPLVKRLNCPPSQKDRGARNIYNNIFPYAIDTRRKYSNVIRAEWCCICHPRYMADLMQGLEQDSYIGWPPHFFLICDDCNNKNKWKDKYECILKYNRTLNESKFLR